MDGIGQDRLGQDRLGKDRLDKQQHISKVNFRCVVKHDVLKRVI